jgi:UDP-glucuronate 4-epimerase
MKILVTGSAGFIGSEVTLSLLNRGDEVIGIDNHNDYYDPKIKNDRVERHIHNPNYTHLRIDLSNREAIDEAFKKHKPNRVINLAAQAGIRYSIKNPLAYINSNIVGFAHILEACRHHNIEHLVYASSSSVYGSNTKIPFSTDQNADHPISLYAATKKSNELMAHTYSHLYSLPTTGLRFFTVYGPWDRPDMALQKFTRAIINGETIKIFNHGNHLRDFTFIDDIVEGVIRVLDNKSTSNPNWVSKNPEPNTSSAPWSIYNIGNNKPVKLIDYITTLEKFLEKKAEKIFLPIQPGDVADTWANMNDFSEKFKYYPKVSIEVGISKFVSWYRGYYSK